MCFVLIRPMRSELLSVIHVCMSVMVGIDQSCIGSADKANKDGPTTAATAPTLKRKKKENTSQPHLINDS